MPVYFCENIRWFLVTSLIRDMLLILFFMLWQVIQTLPPPLLEVPLSLLSRLLLCDPARSVSHLSKSARDFFMLPQHQVSLTRTASSLLFDLLQLDVLWDSAVELLTLLSQVARCSAQPACLQLQLEASVLHQGLHHPYDPIRAATCRLLANMHPFKRPTQQPAIFQNIINCLHDPFLPVRRMACRAVGNWLGYISTEAGFKSARSNGTGSDLEGCGNEKQKNKNKCSHSETAGGRATVVKQGAGEEELSRWSEEARRAAAMLASRITDPDAHTRRHCCAALANLVNVDGAVSLMLEEDVTSLLLTATCTDSHNAVRQAAIATLCLYGQQDATRQVTMNRFL